MELLTVSEAARYLKRDVKCLQQYEHNGILIPYTRTKTNRRMYTRAQLNDFLNIKEGDNVNQSRSIVCYCRVSSYNQKPDLENQIKILKEYCLMNDISGYEVISEIGGGLNFKRKKFLKLMDDIESNGVKMVILSHKDRLARFGFEFIEHICKRHDCEIKILDQEKSSPEKEMVQDLMTIIHCFSSRLYGLRNYRKKLKESLKCNK